MGSRGQAQALLIGLALVGAGAALMAAWHHAMWASVAGTLLVAVWLLALPGWARHGADRPERRQHAPPLDGGDMATLRLLLDQVPTPLVGIEGDSAKPLNRAARSLFASQDCINPVPAPMLEPTSPRMVHGGRHWRIDRVEAGGTAGPRAILALIDVEAEERSGEARAAAEMIQVMGHEMLNGLAPIVSLAESGLAAWQQSEPQRAQLMPDILTTLARRAESLQRFAEAYRTLARLPEPAMASIASGAFLSELALMFGGRWRDQIALRVEGGSENLVFPGDKDQLTQAVWALLQNAAEAALAGAGEPWVRLSIAFTDVHTTITVSDSGEGVPSAQRARIFHPFHTTKAEGTGIGLSLSRHIARAHGGDLHLLDSLPTSFTISLLPGHQGTC